MSDFIRKIAGSWRDYLLVFVKWGAVAILVGIICGAVGTVFHILLNLVSGWSEACGWLLYLLPAAGLVIVAGYRACGAVNPLGTNLVLMSIRSDRDIPATMTPLIFVSTLLTHLCGGSAGREGAALQIGGGLGALIARAAHFRDTDHNTVIMCGMSAVFAALFGTPVTAAIFSMEVISVGIMHYSAFFPCIVSALIASRMAGAFGIEAVSFAMPALPAGSVGVYGRVILLGVLCALCSVVFILAMHGTGALYARFLPNQYARVAVGGALVIAVTLVVGSRDYNGAGMAVIARAVAGETIVPWAFALKMLLTALTLTAGFKGGEIVPSFFIGATFGSTMGALLGLDAGFGACLGLAAVFCAVVNCPVTALILSVELFGAELLPFMAPICAVSYLMSGSFSLYTGQSIVYSKLNSHYVNTDAHN